MPQTAGPFCKTFADVDDEIRAEVANAIWGADPDDTERMQRLSHYFDYYIDETTSTVVRTTKRGTARSPIKSHTELLGFVRLLKQHPDKTRRDLKLICPANSADASASALDLDAALDLTVRVMFMASCRSSTAYNIITTNLVFRPIWRESESLEGLVERVLPRYEIDQPGQTDTIRAQKLNVRYLYDYTKVRIEWTNNLPDHLFLQVTDEWISLRVFPHVGFLETCSRALAERDVGISTIESLSLGCLPPDIISETLWTLHLLFPEDDEKARALLDKEIQDKGLDQRLSGPFQLYHGFHETPRDVLLPEDVKSLFGRYPHWGERLYRILKEVEDPTPMTWVEKWADSKKSPRFTYWVGFIALCFALFFGIVASVLGAIQVWISYCAWQDASAGFACGKYGSTQTPAASSTMA
ncbi:hypothetical protein FGG08_001008 [Glutinoglossum americanum]|uniref:Uncharacterized protein n=1 Tax=Glutinoglossum americanum TaxID=1670608 RepID=A0A9P8IHJ1_9PEZI|nr:hypothetical protein FGG08_001008 [Glutinoglossum americanum]